MGRVPSDPSMLRHATSRGATVRRASIDSAQPGLRPRRARVAGPVACQRALDLRDVVAVRACEIADVFERMTGELVGTPPVAAAVPQGARERELDGDAQIGSQLAEVGRELF